MQSDSLTIRDLAEAFSQQRYLIAVMFLAGLLAGIAKAQWDDRLTSFETVIQISGLAVPQVIAPTSVQEHLSRVSGAVARKAHASRQFALPEGSTTVTVISPSTLAITTKDRPDQRERVARYHNAILESLRPESLIPSDFAAEDMTKAVSMVEEALKDANDLEGDVAALTDNANIRIQQHIANFESISRDSQSSMMRLLANKMTLQLNRLQGYLNRTQTDVNETIRQLTSLKNLFSDAISIHPQSIAELKAAEPKTVSMAFSFSLLGLVIGCAIAYIIYFIKLTVSPARVV